MHNEDAPSGIVKALIRRKLAISALRRIHSLIKEDEANESHARGVAARGTGVLFASGGIFFMWTAAIETPLQLVTGVSSVTSLVAGAMMLLLLLALAIGSFAASAYLWLPGPRPIRPFARRALEAWLAAGIIAAAVYIAVTPVTRCPASLAIPKQNFDEALGDLTHCLASASLQPETRRAMLQARARAQYRIGNVERAVEDLEASFAIEPPRGFVEIGMYSRYLRNVGRLNASLDVITQAGPQTSPAETAVLEYERARTLEKLGRDSQAIDAFTQVLSANRSHAWAYWSRGLLYEKTGQRDAARLDFEACSRHLNSRSDLRPDDRGLLGRVNAKLLEYEPAR